MSDQAETRILPSTEPVGMAVAMTMVDIGIAFTNVPANVSFRITVNGQLYGALSDKLKHQAWVHDMTPSSKDIENAAMAKTSE